MEAHLTEEVMKQCRSGEGDLAMCELPEKKKWPPASPWREASLIF